MIAWVDTETSGLDPRNGHLLEVAFVLTDDNLVEIGHLSTTVQPVGSSIDAAMANVDPIVYEMHGANGLMEEIRSGRGMRRYEAEDMLVGWLVNTVAVYAGAGGHVDTGALEPYAALKDMPLAGSTVGFDRAWLREHMSRLEALFNYRSIDVSSITELAKRWAPAIYEGRPKAGKAHRALSDVRESIAYLRYYRECGFIGGMK